VFHSSVREMLARVGSDELTEWEAAYRLDPWGEARTDRQAGVVAATIINVLRQLTRTTEGRDATANDFAMVFAGGGDDDNGETAADWAARLMAITLGAGGEVK
jgi:hypothetical protein